MKILIVGKNGQLGKALSSTLTARGIEFNALGSKDLDITSLSKTFELVSALRPELIINAAGWTNVNGAETSVNEAFAANSDGPRNLALAAKKTGAIFVHISTDYVFSGQNLNPWNEQDATSPISEYGRSKAAGEKSVMLLYPEKSYIFRAAWLYSQWNKNFAKTMTRLALETPQASPESNLINVVNDQIGQPTYTSDLSDQIINSVFAKIPFGIHHATNSGKASWFEFAREIFIHAGGDISRLIPISTLEYAQPAKRPKYSVLGHNSWGKTDISPMRDWRIALKDAMPAIVSAVKAGG